MSRARDLADRVLQNRTHEDTEGGRESNLTFKGEQSGGEISTLAQIQASHDGTGDDQKADLIFKTNDGSDGASPTEAARIDSQSNFLIGHSDNTNVAGHEAALQIVGQGTADYHGSTISIIGNANNTNGAYLNFAKTRSNTAGTATAAAAGDVVGEINFSAADGTDLANRIGYIQAKVNDNVASNDTAGRLEFATTAQGSGTPATRLRIDEHGIKFGSDTAEANGLHAYEEGTFTPLLSGSKPSGGDPTYNVQLGLYTKIGNVVEFNLTIACVASSLEVQANNLVITGLPFTNVASASPNPTDENYPAPTVWPQAGINNTSTTQGYGALIANNSTNITIYGFVSSTGVNYVNVKYNQLSTSSSANSFQIRITGTYRTA